MLGLAKDLMGSYAPGLYVFGSAFLLGALILLELGTRWSAQWTPAAVRQTGVFSYRGGLSVPGD